jgi:hypothetical protein
VTHTRDLQAAILGGDDLQGVPITAYLATAFDASARSRGRHQKFKLR